jgi:GNAT superfamily N-acetyltransferase
VEPELSELEISPLTLSHKLDDFESGSPSLDAWLRKHAVRNQNSGDSMTRIAEIGGHVVGFYTLSTTSVMRSLLPGSLRRNAADPISALLLGHLAVDRRYQRRGIGSMLVRDALRNAMIVSRHAGWRLLAVHPESEAAQAFWAKLDFVLLLGVSPALMALSQAMVRTLLAAVDSPSTRSASKALS